MLQQLSNSSNNLADKFFYKNRGFLNMTNHISDKSTVGTNVTLGYNVIIEDNVSISNNVEIRHNVIIRRVRVSVTTARSLTELSSAKCLLLLP